ncbi:MAG TPA: hypothetical protein PKW05_11285 [Anaerolineae bacterium]|nr:hypothetical protein [Anaerolineae bacterium]
MVSEGFLRGSGVGVDEVLGTEDAARVLSAVPLEVVVTAMAVD